MNMKEAIAKATDRIDRGQSRDDFPGGGKARQPLHFFKIRSRRCIRGTWSKYHGRTCACEKVCGSGWNWIYVCTAFQ